MHRFDPLDQSFYEYELKIKYEEIIQIETMLKTINKTNGFTMRTTFDSINVLSLPLLKNLREQILKILDSHNLLLDNNWAQLYNEDESHPLHLHGLEGKSGILYLKSNATQETIFYSPSFEPYKYPFKKNHLLLYPSHIPHEVKSLKTNESRLIIAFNTRKIKK
tara:strand:- start:565 stop:1056 length:492 start_codon:yes stop_codon:yes gene_type:complete